MDFLGVKQRIWEEYDKIRKHQNGTSRAWRATIETAFNIVNDAKVFKFQPDAMFASYTDKKIDINLDKLVPPFKSMYLEFPDKWYFGPCNSTPESYVCLDGEMKTRENADALEGVLIKDITAPSNDYKYKDHLVTKMFQVVFMFTDSIHIGMLSALDCVLLRDCPLVNSCKHTKPFDEKEDFSNRNFLSGKLSIRHEKLEPFGTTCQLRGGLIKCANLPCVDLFIIASLKKLFFVFLYNLAEGNTIKELKTHCTREKITLQNSKQTIKKPLPYPYYEVRLAKNTKRDAALIKRSSGWKVNYCFDVRSHLRFFAGGVHTIVKAHKRGLNVSNQYIPKTYCIPPGQVKNTVTVIQRIKQLGNYIKRLWVHWQS